MFNLISRDCKIKEYTKSTAFPIKFQNLTDFDIVNINKPETIFILDLPSYIF